MFDMNWRGTAADLARSASEYFLSLGSDEPKLNERLVRYYVQKKLLSPPEREALEPGGFRYQHFLELIVIRELARDGWPLEKIGAFIRSADQKALLDLIDNQTMGEPDLLKTVIRRAMPETRRLVLAVNDDPHADVELYDWLTTRGVAVLRAYSTAHALTLLDRARPHLVISDLARVENDVVNKRAGIELARIIRERGSDVPMVIFTRDKAARVKDLAVDAGANYVTERIDDLREWLQKLGL